MAQLATDCLYRGERRKSGTRVMVHEGPGDYHLLAGADVDPFDWGRPTRGARWLARVLLREAAGAIPDGAVEDRFLHEVVLKLPFVEPWVLWRGDLKTWVTASSPAPEPGEQVAAEL